MLRIIAGLSISLSLIAVSNFAQQSAAEIFERARMLDESNQNLTEAIRLYRQVILQSKDRRPLAAIAQYRLGLLYERLGRRAEAQETFKAVVKEYADQTDVARRAQARIVANGKGKQAPGILVKETGPSPDGWYSATFTCRTKQVLTHPIVDSAGHRLYVLTQLTEEPANDADYKRAQRLGLSYIYEPSNLIVIDTRTKSVVQTIPFSAYLGDLAFNSASKKLYAPAQIEGYVAAINLSNFSHTKIPVPGRPTNIAVNSVTNKIYVTSQGFAGNDKLFVMDGTTHALTGPFDLEGVAAGLTLNSATNRIYAVAEPKTRVFRGVDNSLLADLPGVRVIDVDPIHNRLYATASFVTAAPLQVLDGNSHSIIRTLDHSTGYIAVNPEFNRLFASLTEKRQLAVIDTTTHTLLSRLLVADSPYALAVDRATGHTYVCHNDEARTIGMLSKQSLDGRIAEDFSDSFDSVVLDPAWTPASGEVKYSLSENPGNLRFRAGRGAGPQPRSLLLRKFGGDSWDLRVKVSYFTGKSGGARDLFFIVTFGAPPSLRSVSGANPQRHLAQNFVRLSRAREDWNGCCPGETSRLFVENGNLASYHPLPPSPSDEYIWQIKRRGRTVTVEVSNDGIQFRPFGSHTFGPQIDGIIQYFAFGSNNHANHDAYADYHYVRLTGVGPR